MSEQDNRKWSWWAVEVDRYDEKPETYRLNEETREAVIAAGRREYGPFAILAIIEATQDGPFNARPFDEKGDCPLVMEIIEKFSDDNGGRWGEDGGDLGVFTMDLGKALNDAFEAHARANHVYLLEAAWSFTGTRNAEYVHPEADGDPEDAPA